MASERLGGLGPVSVCKEGPSDIYNEDLIEDLAAEIQEGGFRLGTAVQMGKS